MGGFLGIYDEEATDLLQQSWQTPHPKILKWRPSCQSGWCAGRKSNPWLSRCGRKG